jgi:hypothetical protein
MARPHSDSSNLVGGKRSKRYYVYSCGRDGHPADLEAEYDSAGGLLAHRYRLDRHYKILVSAERKFYAWPAEFQNWLQEQMQGEQDLS